VYAIGALQDVVGLIRQHVLSLILVLIYGALFITTTPIEYELPLVKAGDTLNKFEKLITYIIPVLILVG
jgi:hypothetical protein